MQRVVTPELMDDPGVDRGELRRSLAYIRAVNRWLGGWSMLERWLNAWRGELSTGPVTLLDIATGSADLPVRAVAWAKARGVDLRVTAVDVHEGTLDEARRHVDEAGAGEHIDVVKADAFELVDRFGVGSFDIVHAGLFVHHLRELPAMTMLAAMDRLSRHGLVWNDLMRTRIGYAAIHVMTLGQPKIVRHDACVSVRAGFALREAKSMAVRADWHEPKLVSNFLTHRFSIGSWR
ncbi:MAG: methyltransferase domain-containing protein [Planctomycetota bacterium]